MRRAAKQKTLYIANRIGFEMPWLAATFDKLKARHGLDADQIWAVLPESPLFGEDQRGILVHGLAAWLSGDHVKAIKNRPRGAPVLRQQSSGGIQRP